MKFRRGFLILIAGALLIAWFTKPSKDDFIKRVQPEISRGQLPPVVEYQDKFLYTSVTATYVDAGNPVMENNRMVAPSRKESYIGLFGRYWKQQ